MANKPSAPSVFVIHPPTAAPLPKTTAGSTATKIGDSTPPGASARPAGTTVSQELRAPIEDLKGAIESRLPTRIESVYAAYDQDDPTKRYFKGIIDRADSIHVKPMVYESSDVKRNTAQLTYRMIMTVTFNASKIPTDVPSSWRAELVRESPGSAWKIHRLTRLAVSPGA